MKQKLPTLLWLICLILAILLICRMCGNQQPKAAPEDMVREQLQQLHTAPTRPASEENQPEAYVSPVDFESLAQQNEEIIAWLDIPDTTISYPVLRSEEDNEFYLHHGAQKQIYSGGALFVEDYNCRELTDPVTVIYGHRMGSLFFGPLQQNYETERAFAAHRTIYLYLPDRLETYMAVAAVPYSNNHILYNYDFTDEMEHYRFFDRAFMVRHISAQVDMDNYPEFGEKVLILSTCFSGSRSNRYLVIAKEVTSK